MTMSKETYRRHGATPTPVVGMLGLAVRGSTPAPFERLALDSNTTCHTSEGGAHV